MNTRTPKSWTLKLLCVLLATAISGCATTSTPTAKPVAVTHPKPDPAPPIPPSRGSVAFKYGISKKGTVMKKAAVVKTGAKEVLILAALSAPHLPPYFSTNNVPYPLVFLNARYLLTGGVTYQFETAENPAMPWIATIDPYTAPAGGEELVKSISFSVNGTVVPRQFMRMRVVP